MAKTIVLTQQEGLRFCAKYGTNEVIVDSKKEKGGTGLGLSPGELLCASLGACTAMRVVRYYKTIGIPLEGVRAEATYEEDQKNSRGEKFEVRIFLPMGFHGRKGAVKRVAEACYVKNTLQNPPEIKIRIEGLALD
jgi:putative redox protein